MKKTLKIITILVIGFILCACKEDREYYLTEITGNELMQNIISEEMPNIIFAFYDSDANEYEDFVNSLDELSKTAKIDIYSVDIAHLDIASSIILFNLNQFYTDGFSYYAYINGQMQVANQYTTYDVMYKDLKNYSYNSDIIRVEETELQENLEKAKSLYSEDQLSDSLNYLNLAWSLKEAKEFYNENDYYKFLNTWERVDFTDETEEVMIYSNIYVSSQGSIIYRITTNINMDENFQKPSPFTDDDYEMLYYQLKDDIVYTSKESDGKYKETYKILEIKNNILKLYDYQDKTEYYYVIRS